MNNARGLLEQFLVEEFTLEETGLFALGIEGPVERDAENKDSLVCKLNFLDRSKREAFWMSPSVTRFSPAHM